VIMSEPFPNVSMTETHPPSDLPSRRTMIIWVGLGLMMAILLGVKFFQDAMKSTARKPLPVYGQLQDFELIERTGKSFGSIDLKGKVWIADFIFTRCGGPCPQMTYKMGDLQKNLETVPEIKFVSFSVDPEHDTPQELTEYAQQFHAQEGRWFFLTGRMEEIQALAKQSFKIILQDNKVEQRQVDEGSILHSTHFILVDSHGQVRGYYDSSTPEQLKKLQEDAVQLVREGVRI